MPNRAGPELGTIDVVTMLQDELGVDEAQARDLASIEVACPVPGEDRQSSLGEFMASEHGADKADEIINIASQAQESGATAEEALSQALGFAAVRDKSTGELSRVTQLESKKK